MINMFWNPQTSIDKNTPISTLVLFDIDGTLVLSGDLHRRAFEASLDAICQIKASVDWSKYYGRTDPWILQDILQANLVSPPKIDELIPKIIQSMSKFYSEHHTEEIGKTLPGVPEFLSRLDSEKILRGLVTGNVEEIAYYKLSHYHIAKGFALGGFGSENADRSKLLLLAIQKAESQFNFHYNGHNVVYIADSPNDIKAANLAQIPCVIVLNQLGRNYDFSQLKPALFLPDMTHQMEFFSFLNNHKK
jgi:phosphoglycolate phosphatase-like HAD superfamily hydrolase